MRGKSVPVGVRATRYACNVLERGCQEQIFDIVQCVRGTPGELPEVRVVTEEEYEELISGDGPTESPLMEERSTEERARTAGS